MKKMMKVFALAMACMMNFSASQKKPQENTPVNTQPSQQQTTETKPSEEKKEEPKADPKDEILAKAEADKEAMLGVMQAVIDTYRSGTLPDYYEAYPAKEAYPALESTDEISLEKGSGESDVLMNVKVGNLNLCVSLKYVDGSENPWMVLKTAFGGIKG